MIRCNHIDRRAHNEDGTVRVIYHFTDAQAHDSPSLIGDFRIVTSLPEPLFELNARYHLSFTQIDEPRFVAGRAEVVDTQTTVINESAELVEALYGDDDAGMPERPPLAERLRRSWAETGNVLQLMYGMYQLIDVAVNAIVHGQEPAV